MTRTSRERPEDAVNLAELDPDFAIAYADQNETDHVALVEAIADGRVVATSGI